MNRLLCAALVLCLFVSPALLAQTTGTSTPVAPKVDTLVLSPTSTEGMKVLYPYLILIAIIACLPMLIDIVMTYAARIVTTRRLAELVKADKAELKGFVDYTSRSPSGMKGLYRAAMALAVIAVIGIAVFHVLVFYHNSKGEVSPVLNSVLGIMGGLVAAVTGFYFGGRATAEGASQGAEQGAEQAKQAAAQAAAQAAQGVTQSAQGAAQVAQGAAQAAPAAPQPTPSTVQPAPVAPPPDVPPAEDDPE